MPVGKIGTKIVLPSKKKAFFLLLLLGAGFAGAGYLMHTSGVLALFLSKERLLDFIHGHSAYAAWLFIFLQALQVVAAPVPGEVTGLVGGFIFGPVRGVLYSTAGLALGSWLAFMLARLLGRPLVEKLVSQDTISRYDYVMRHKGLFLAFLMFLIPGFPKDFLCYLLGLGHMRQREFLMVSVSGRLLGTVLLTLGGAYIRDQRYGALFLLVGISLLVTLIALVYRERLEGRFRSMAVKHKKPGEKR